MFRFPGARDRQKPGERGRTDTGAALQSLANVIMPWGMESTRTKLGFYFTFILFHLGVVVGIFLAFVSSLYEPLVKIPAVSYAFTGILGAACLIGVGRIIRRFTNPVIRLISSPDDHFCVFMLTGWFLTGTLAQAHFAGWLPSQWYLVAFLGATSFFLIYVPFSKISHYLYYPFTRYWIGRTLAHRGSFPR